MYVIITKIDNITKYANYFPETHSKIVTRTIYYHFHVGYRAVRYQGMTKQLTMQRRSLMYTPSGRTTQKWRHNDVEKTSFWRCNDVIIAQCSRWTKTRLFTHVKKKTIWSFSNWDWNIPRWKFHSNVVPCKHHQVIISRHIHGCMVMLEKTHVWVNIFLSSTRRIPTTCAISVLLDENEICFYFIQVNSGGQGLNKYGKIPIHIISN